MNEFVHLHVHSDYSILDAISRIDDLVAEAARQGYKSLALTDHGAMHGCIEFYKACIDHEIKPIMGVEFYCARNTIGEKRSTDNPTDHLLVLAKDDIGYQNLLKLSTLSSTEGFHYTPRVDLSLLEAHSEGLICTSSCMSGAVQRLANGQTVSVRTGNTWQEEHIEPSISAARDYASDLRDVFGQGNFFLEVQDHSTENKQYLPGINQHRCEDYDRMVKGQSGGTASVAEIARDLDIPLVVTNDVHYVKQEEWNAKDTVFAIRTSDVKQSPDRKLCNNSDQAYLKSQKEMCERFKNYPSAIRNTVAIAEACNVNIAMGENHIPVFDTNGKDLIKYWRGMVIHGFQKRYPEGNALRQKAWDRLSHEIVVIEKMGFVSYFLMVNDFVKYAQARDIPVGPGRGSVAGSIVSYCLGITVLCPLEHKLMFERFLNSDRISLPDIDLDFCKRRVNEIYSYAIEKYGKKNVARIATFGSMWAKSLVRTVGKAHGLPKEEIDVVASSLPETSGEYRADIEEQIKNNNTVGAFYEQEDWKKALDESIILQGVKRNVGKHAAGIVIADDDLMKYIPLMRSTKKKAASSRIRLEGEDMEAEETDMLYTQIGMDHLEDLGLIKMDFLALETLTIIQRALNMMKDKINYTEFTERTLDFSDSNTYSLLRSGKTLGVFQVESPGLRDLLVQIQPTTFHDIVDAIALYRPGPMDHIDERTGLSMLATYIYNRNKKKSDSSFQYDVISDAVEEVVSSTYGVIVYQEQIMEIVKRVCGLSSNDADRFRKAVGKKVPELVEKERPGFTKAATNYGKMSKETAIELFETIAAFARYGFNKSHAAGYAVITYQTAWLKANYHKEFMCALLTSAGQKSKVDDRRKYIEDCVMSGTKIYAPNINLSREHFQIMKDGLLAGLSMVRGLDKAAATVVEERDKSGEFSSVHNMISRLVSAGCSKLVLESIIESGTADVLMDNEFNTRAKMITAITQLIQITRDHAKRTSSFTSILPEDLKPKVDLSLAESETEAVIRKKTVEYYGVYCIPDE